MLPMTEARERLAAALKIIEKMQAVIAHDSPERAAVGYLSNHDENQLALCRSFMARRPTMSAKGPR